jgi:flagellar hook-basal body complex protein FliE
MDKINLNMALQRAYAVESAKMRGVGSSQEAAGAGGADFSNILKGALDKVNDSQTLSKSLGEQFQLGNPKVSLEETVLASQAASLNFQTLVTTRNRLVTAYNDIMNMPV